MADSSSIILPGRTLGVLGSGQLGRMFAHAAQRLGYLVHTYSDAPNSPCGQVAAEEFVGAYDDVDAIEKFAQSVDVVTFEFENISAAAAQAIEKHVPVRPGGHVLHTSQHRVREKSTLAQAGLPVTPFQEVNSSEDLQAAIANIGAPAILKTSTGGYDGKGQVAIRSADEAEAAWQELNSAPAIWEKAISFQYEISMIGVRGVDGSIATCGPIRNDHANHILDVSVWPDPESESLTDATTEITQGVLKALDVVGVMCVEMFVEESGNLLINEVAPRPHNSGHLTIEACACSQFEQQVRAICGLPLGDMSSRGPAAMANLLGSVWSGGEPNWSQALSGKSVSLHLYGKESPRPGRKMGHITAIAETAEAARAKALTAREQLSASGTQ